MGRGNALGNVQCAVECATIVHSTTSKHPKCSRKCLDVILLSYKTNFIPESQAKVPWSSKQTGNILLLDDRGGISRWQIRIMGKAMSVGLLCFTDVLAAAIGCFNGRIMFIIAHFFSTHNN